MRNKLWVMSFLCVSSLSYGQESESDRRISVSGRYGSMLGLGYRDAGAEGAYRLLPDLQITGGFVAGKVSDRDSGSSDDDVKSGYNLSSSVAMIGARYFLGNSFNLSGGLGYRKLDFGYRAGHKVVGGVDVDGEANAVVVGSAIGNLWQFDSGLFIGVDWIGMLLPVAHASRASAKGAGIGLALVDSEQEEAEELAQDMSRRPTVILGMIGVGYSF